MTKPVRSSLWQDMRRLLTSKSKIELRNLIRDLYALTTDNKDFIHTQGLTSKQTTPKARQPKKPSSSMSKVVPKIRQLATIARELREGASFNITRLAQFIAVCRSVKT
jgi:hypothetical protein